MSGPRPRAAPAALVVALTLVLLAGVVLPAPPLAAGRVAGERVGAFGADLTPDERQELSQLFGVDPSTRIETVTTPEMVAALGGTGLPVALADKSISSTALTCLDQGAGLAVRTRSISRIPPAVYASALVTAGIEGQVLIAAPSANPVSGETALVGVLKASGLCPGASPVDPARARLAYEQVGRAVALAGPGGNLAAAGNALQQAAQAVIAGRAGDDAAIGAALDTAAAAQGLPLDPAQRGETIAFLKRLGGLDYGAYAGGYRLQQLSPSEVRAEPTGTPGPATAPAPTATTARAPADTGRERAARGLWEESMEHLRAAVAAYVPRAVAALALVVGGLVLAALAGGATNASLRRLGFDELAGRVGLTGLLLAGNIRRSPARVVGSVVFYAILLLALLAALGPLGLGFLTQTLDGVALFLPRLLLAALLLVLGAALAGWAAQGTARALAGAGVARARWPRAVVRFVLLFVAGVLAAAILGLDVTLLIALAVIGLGAMALAAALAIGLGLRGLSQNIAAGRYVAEGIAEGDRIRVNGVAGTVEEIGHAQTTLRDADGRVFLVPNSHFLEHVVEKQGPGPEAEAQPARRDET